MVFFIVKIALFFDDKGEFIGKEQFHKFNNTINFNNKSFNIITDNPSSFITKNPFFKTHYHFYNVNNPMPLIFKKNVEPVLNSELYNAMLMTNVTTRLNNLHNKGIFANIGLKEVLIGLAIIGFIIYLVMGGKII